MKCCLNAAAIRTLNLFFLKPKMQLMTSYMALTTCQQSWKSVGQLTLFFLLLHGENHSTHWTNFSAGIRPVMGSVASVIILMWDFKFSRRRVWCSGRQSFYMAVYPRRQLWTSIILMFTWASCISRMVICVSSSLALRLAHFLADVTRSLWSAARRRSVSRLAISSLLLMLIL
jgi:hypothetical protein